MTPLRPVGDWSGCGLAHEGFVFGADEELLRRVLPFVHDGFEREEPVLVVAGERVRDRLADSLGDDVGRLAVFAAAEPWWRGGPGTLLAYDEDLRALRRSSPSWRLVAEPVWLAREDGRVWSRFESVANRCYADLPYYSLCLHDRTRLDDAVLEEVARTHPLIWDSTQPVPSPTYEVAESFLSSVEPAWEPRPTGVTSTTVTSARAARALVDAATAPGWSARRDDVALAVEELVTNAVRAAGTAYVSFWTDGEVLVCEVSDPGPGMHDVTAGYVPPPADGERGRGLWIARSLADDATVAPAGPGTRIRLFFRR